jgi:ell wall binding domain 2 (CWB2)
MRASTLRLPAVLVLLGVALGGVLAGCGKGSSVTSGESRTASSGFGAAPQARGVLGIATKNTTRLGGADAASDAAAVAEAVYPGFTPTTRPQAVVLVNERDFSAALVASALASAPLGAPLLYADGDSLPEVTEQALRAMRPVGASALGGAQVIRVDTDAALPDGLRARDVSAAATSTATSTSTSAETSPAGEVEPAALAAAVAQLAATIGGKPAHDVLVVASDAPLALQMPAAGLSAESRAPILLVTSSSVPAATSAALRALHHPTIYVIAPTTLHASAYAALKRLGAVVHVSGSAGVGESPSDGAGSNAVENAISVSRFSHGAFGWGVHEAGHGLVFANAARPLDAPAAAPLSAHGDYAPLLLLEGASAVPAPLTHYLSDIEPGYTEAVPPVREVYNHGWLIGDERAISARAQAELDTVLEIAPRQPSEAEQSVSEAE